MIAEGPSNDCGKPVADINSIRTFQSARAWPGGSIAFRTRWIRRSPLVKVPSFSRKLAPGSTTSASEAVSER